MCKFHGLDGKMYKASINAFNSLCTRHNFTRTIYVRLQSVNAVGRNESIFVVRPCIGGKRTELNLTKGKKS